MRGGRLSSGYVIDLEDVDYVDGDGWRLANEPIVTSRGDYRKETKCPLVGDHV